MNWKQIAVGKKSFFFGELLNYVFSLAFLSFTCSAFAFAKTQRMALYLVRRRNTPSREACIAERKNSTKTFLIKFLTLQPHSTHRIFVSAREIGTRKKLRQAQRDTVARQGEE